MKKECLGDTFSMNLDADAQWGNRGGFFLCLELPTLRRGRGDCIILRGWFRVIFVLFQVSLNLVFLFGVALIVPKLIQNSSSRILSHQITGFSLQRRLLLHGLLRLLHTLLLLLLLCQQLIGPSALLLEFFSSFLLQTLFFLKSDGLDHSHILGSGHRPPQNCLNPDHREEFSSVLSFLCQFNSCYITAHSILQNYCTPPQKKCSSTLHLINNFALEQDHT
mmetsp:Transcript_4152/g.9219  ORF Transcript_4152/g.9219 Transcript_4152/m.9219 type:complete len:221 (-) Transcript_4152:2320-2982(-)